MLISLTGGLALLDNSSHTSSTNAMQAFLQHPHLAFCNSVSLGSHDGVNGVLSSFSSWRNGHKEVKCFAAEPK